MRTCSSFVCIVLFSSALMAGKLPDSLAPGVASKAVNLDDLKMRKRFGAGISAGGPLSILGVEVDVNLTTDLSLSAGVGTGLDYSTFMVKARYFLPGEWVSPYLALGVARWTTDKPTDERIAPSVLRSKFLGGKSANGFDFVLLSPAAGVQFMMAQGIGFFLEVEVLAKLFDFSYGTYAGGGLHWYL